MGLVTVLMKRTTATDLVSEHLLLLRTQTTVFSISFHVDLHISKSSTGSLCLVDATQFSNATMSSSLHQSLLDSHLATFCNRSLSLS